MTATDWYRNIEWTPAVSDEFEQRLARSRGQRSEYLRIQALSLAETKNPKYASTVINLAQRQLELKPESISSAQMHATIALAFEMLGETSEALDSYQRAVSLELRRPNVRGYHYLDFSWFVATNGISSHYEPALSSLTKNVQDQDLLFPINQYRYYGSLALIYSALGEKDKARSMAKLALESAVINKGPFWRYPLLGLVKDKSNAIRSQLQKIAS